jgi:EPS-associated MarR family transcriptional regulator
MPIVGDETRYRLLKYLSEHPDASQRDLARHLGVSVGKINYCLAALVSRGWVKVQNFKRSPQKTNYLYVLTAKGLEEKVNVTYAFWKRKMTEYDALRDEIERLSSEIELLPEEDSTTR